MAVSVRESALPKVFGIGLGKTGTTSLHEALTILGWRSIHNPPAEIVARLLAGDPGWYNAFSDNPIQTHFRELDALYPGSKFILTTRPFEDWIASRIRHRNAWGAPGWEFDPEKLRQWWEWHHLETRKHFGERMLVLNLGDGWEPLCRYLGVPVPDQPYPWANKSPPQRGSIDRLKEGAFAMCSFWNADFLARGGGSLEDSAAANLSAQRALPAS